MFLLNHPHRISKILQLFNWTVNQAKNKKPNATDYLGSNNENLYEDINSHSVIDTVARKSSNYSWNWANTNKKYQIIFTVYFTS